MRRYGVLKDNQSIFSGKMMSAGFDLLYESEKPEVDIVESLIVNDKIDLDIDEWAEELAVLNKRRNLLERRLREITLNFIRYDAMQSSNLPELTSRIIKIIPDTQRAHLSHLSATEILSKFMWTDLVKLITKEWRIFEKLFGDKSEFINHCGVINERYDAHAKNADAADFAMYRRSLKYVEERISKLH